MNGMRAVRVAGATEPMRRLGEIAGLDFERTTARRVGEDRWEVAGYATDEALAAVRERGLDVEEVVEPAPLAEQRPALYARLQAEAADEAGES
jgi:hypothetical protein